MKSSFVTIDFETANSSRASVCEVGLCKVVEGRLHSTLQALVLPPADVRTFHPINVGLHGITEDTVKDEWEWPRIWQDIQDFIGDLPLVAHNASFDLSVLRAVLNEYSEDWPEYEYWCTWVMSKAALNLASYSLSSVSKNLEIEHEESHRALSDAMTAARVAIALLERTETSSFEEAGKALGVRGGMLYNSHWITCRKISNLKEDEDQRLSQRLQSLNIDRDFVDPGGDFRGKQVAITGSLDSMTRAEAQELLFSSGAKVTSSISKNLDYLVSGAQDLRKLSEGDVQSAKYRKVMELRSQGKEIEIIDEEQFLQLLRS